MRAKSVLSGLLVLCLGVQSQAHAAQDASTGDEFPIQDLQELCDWMSSSNHPNFGGLEVGDHRTELEAELAGLARPIHLASLEIRVSSRALAMGNTESAIQLLESARRRFLEVGSKKRAASVMRYLGIAHIRQGEIDHCIAMHNPDSCLFPIGNDGVWSDPSGARLAIADFEKYLEKLDDPGVRWLLNVANMTAGTFPEGVPAEYRLPDRVVDEVGPVPRFRDVATDVGINTFNLAGGAVMDDIDGDGFLDLVTSSMGPCDPMFYFHNEGDGSFADWTARAGLDGQLGGLNMIHADENGDGRLDLFVLRGAWMGQTFGRQRNSLLRQQEDGTFEDVTLAAGLSDVAYPCIAADFGDCDNDGDLDLYIANENFQDQLFRNNGDGTYTDVTREAGIDAPGISKGVAFGDYDNDGWLDIFVSDLARTNHLFHNQGDGTYRSVESPVCDRTRTFATWFFDLNNDGWLDIYLGSRDANLSQVAADYFGEPNDGGRQRLYLNREGTYEDVTAEYNLADVRTPMGANFGDVDNDGFLDIYLGTGKPGFEWLVPNVLYHNQGGERFTNATAAAGVGHLQKGHGIAFGDIDNDGDQDIFAQMGGFFPSDKFHDSLFENPGNDNHWITLKLRTDSMNRFAVGARLALVVRTPDGTRSIHRVVDSGGSFGSSSFQQEIGLGDAEGIESLTITWPATGTVQTFEDVPLDGCFLAVEGQDALKPVDLPVLKLGG